MTDVTEVKEEEYDAAFEDVNDVKDAGWDHNIVPAPDELLG